MHASSADFARRANLSRSAAIDLTPKSVASLACLVPEKRGGSRSSRTLGTGCDGRGSVRRANSARTNDVAADGEVVWSWRSDAGAKVVKTLSRLTGDGGNQAWSPRRARRTPLKPLRREGRMIRLYLWFCRVLFVARGPWVRWAPGLPCALFCFEGETKTIARTQSAPRECGGMPVIPGWCVAPDRRCAIAHRGISRFRVRCGTCYRARIRATRWHRPGMTDVNFNRRWLAIMASAGATSCVQFSTRLLSGLSSEKVGTSISKCSPVSLTI